MRVVLLTIAVPVLMFTVGTASVQGATLPPAHALIADVPLPPALGRVLRDYRSGCNADARRITAQ